MPLGKYCSVQAKTPFPATSKIVPVSAAPSHSCRSGSGRPRRRQYSQSSAPAHRKRSAAIHHGGNVATASRIAGEVAPQKT